jgi:hypothetical protein
MQMLQKVCRYLGIMFGFGTYPAYPSRKWQQLARLTTIRFGVPVVTKSSRICSTN